MWLGVGKPKNTCPLVQFAVGLHLRSKVAAFFTVEFFKKKNPRFAPDMSVEKKNSKSEVSFAKLTSLRIIRLTFLVTFPCVFAVCSIAY